VNVKPDLEAFYAIRPRNGSSIFYISQGPQGVIIDRARTHGTEKSAELDRIT